MAEQVQDVPAHIREIYSHNAFMVNMGVDIDEITCGGAVVSTAINPQKHFNHRGIVHGGLLVALADSVLGVTGASVGAKVVTLSFNMNFIRNVHSDNRRIYVRSWIRHHGHTTMVIEAKMYDDKDELMGTVLTTMYIVGRFEEIPEKW